MAAHTLPDGYVWLGDAFERIWHEIEDGRRLALEAERQVPDPDFSAAMGDSWWQADPAAVQTRDDSRRRVEKMMRTALANGGLHAFIRDPKTGQSGELANREAWWENISFGVPGLSTVLHHLTCPGPETDGRPVFLPTGEVEGFMRANSPATGVIARGDLIAETPWTLPINATPEQVKLLGGSIWLPLSAIVSFLAFGEADAPAGMEPYLEASYRGRASDALFEAAGQGRVRLFGACSLGGPPSIIPEAVFAGPLALADDGTGFDIALGPAPFSDFVRAREGKLDSRRWLNVTVERASLTQWIAACSVTDQGSTKRGGRPPVVNWAVVKREALRIQADEGPLDPAVPEWNCQARLEEKLLQFCLGRFGKEPAPSTLRKRIPDFIATYQRGLCET